MRTTLAFATLVALAACSPRASTAPPMAMISTHLRESFEDEAGAAKHIVGYVKAPDADASILPGHAIERFGLMPPQPLPEDMLRKVAAYVWSLSAPTP